MAIKPNSDENYEQFSIKRADFTSEKNEIAPIIRARSLTSVSSIQSAENGSQKQKGFLFNLFKKGKKASSFEDLHFDWKKDLTKRGARLEYSGNGKQDSFKIEDLLEIEKKRTNPSPLILGQWSNSYEDLAKVAVPGLILEMKDSRTNFFIKMTPMPRRNKNLYEEYILGYLEEKFPKVMGQPGREYVIEKQNQTIEFRIPKESEVEGKKFYFDVNTSTSSAKRVCLEQIQRT